MKKAVYLLVIAVVAGCSTPVVESNYLSDVPDYPELTEQFDRSSRIVVYSTLWVASPIVTALSNAGYTVIDASAFQQAVLNNAAYVIEPLSFTHTTELYKGDLWLFTRLTVLVRSPLHCTEAGIGYRRPPHVFQVYARRKIGPWRTHTATESEYRKNIDLAIRNLLNVREFRKSLE